MPRHPDHRHGLRPSVFTTELWLGPDTFRTEHRTESEAKASFDRARQRMAKSAGQISGVRVWHRDRLLASCDWAPATPLPVGLDGITRVPPADRRISQFQAYNSPEAMGL